MEQMKIMVEVYDSFDEGVGYDEVWNEWFEDYGVVFLDINSLEDVFTTRIMSKLEDNPYMQLNSEVVETLLSDDVYLEDKLDLLEDLGLYVYRGERASAIYPFNDLGGDRYQLLDYLNGVNHYTFVINEVLEDDELDTYDVYEYEHIDLNQTSLTDAISQILPTYFDNAEIYVKCEFIDLRDLDLGDWKIW